MEAASISRTGLPSVDQPWRSRYPAEAYSAAPPQTTMFRYVYEQAKDIPDRTAMIYFERRISFRDFFENIRRAAKGFTALGVKAGDIVTVFSSNTPETVYCIFALNVIGAIPSMEYVTVSDREAVAAVRHTGSKVVLVLDVLLSRFSSLCAMGGDVKIVALPLAGSMPALSGALVKLKTAKARASGASAIEYNAFLKQGRGTEVKEQPFRSRTPAVIVHSGGTTGSPKGVLLSNEALVYIAWAFRFNSPDTQIGDLYMAYIPLFHAFGLGMGLMMPLASGMTVILTPKFDEPTLLLGFKKYKPNHIMGSSSHIPALMNDPVIKKMDLSFLKSCGFGGSKLAESLETALDEFLRAHGSPARPSAGYGMSELASAVCTERNIYYGKVGSVGLPLCQANVKVIDTESGKELGYNVSGELCFSSPGMMLSYYKNDKETEKAFFTDENGVRWLHSGDLGCVDEDGFVFITGRLKRIYSTRAGKGGTMFKLFPDYVAGVIDEVSDVAEAAVVCVEHPDYNRAAVAFVVLKEGADRAAAEERIVSHMNEILASHCIPKRICFADALPLTEIGKVDLRALEAQAAALKIE